MERGRSPPTLLLAHRRVAPRERLAPPASWLTARRLCFEATSEWSPSTESHGPLPVYKTGHRSLCLGGVGSGRLICTAASWVMSPAPCFLAIPQSWSRDSNPASHPYQGCGAPPLLDQRRRIEVCRTLEPPPGPAPGSAAYETAVSLPATWEACGARDGSRTRTVCLEGSHAEPLNTTRALERDTGTAPVLRPWQGRVHLFGPIPRTGGLGRTRTGMPEVAAPGLSLRTTRPRAGLSPQPHHLGRYRPRPGVGPRSALIPPQTLPGRPVSTRRRASPGSRSVMDDLGPQLFPGREDSTAPGQMFPLSVVLGNPRAEK